MTARRCPICRAADLEPAGAALLDQSGATGLPARRWACPRCPDTVVTLPTGEPPRPLPALAPGEAR